MDYRRDRGRKGYMGKGKNWICGKGGERIEGKREVKDRWISGIKVYVGKRKMMI